MFRLIFSIVFAIVALAPGLRAQDATEILRTARMNNLSQSMALDARLRGSFRTIPFRLSLDRGEVSYAFTEPNERVILKFTKDDSDLRLENAKGELSEPDPAGKVRGSGLTFEDISMQFLYWPRAKVVGEETLKMQSCYKIEVHPLRKGTAYGVVRLWVAKDSGAIMRMEGFDGSGRLIKRFEVIGGQQFKGQWFLKTMRIENFDPENGKVAQRAWLDILPPEN